MSYQPVTPFDLGVKAAEAGVESVSAWFGGLQAEPGETATAQADYLKDSWSSLVEQATTLNAIAADTGRDMMRPFESLARLRR